MSHLSYIHVTSNYCLNNAQWHMATVRTHQSTDLQITWTISKYINSVILYNLCTMNNAIALIDRFSLNRN